MKTVILNFKMFVRKTSKKNERSLLRNWKNSVFLDNPGSECRFTMSINDGEPKFLGYKWNGSAVTAAYVGVFSTLEPIGCCEINKQE